ncbi:MAG: hypothetical protein BWY70_01100 [Bacteroidetes bacterium ADurb.Bin408]|nr:MAG: hypothetical protein BWY70_01100 [Bacteroidetes bacterium ADurb.Bin408]
MNTKKHLLKFVFLFITFPLLISAQTKSKDWTLHKETGGIQIFYKYSDCNIPSEGYYREMVLLKFVNTTQTPLKIKWQREAWYNGKCSSCDLDEYKFELELPAGETVTGECDIRTPSKLKIFSKFLDLKSNTSLDKFNITVLEVNPY